MRSWMIGSRVAKEWLIGRSKDRETGGDCEEEMRRKGNECGGDTWRYGVQHVEHTCKG